MAKRSAKTEGADVDGAERALAAAARTIAELRRSDEAHRLLFDASPLPLIVFDVETLAILAANEAALLLYGYERAEFTRTRMSDLARDDHDAVRRRTALMGGGEALRIRTNYRKDGRAVVVEFTSRVLTFEGRRARITIVKDVTERHAAEQTRALLAAIVESSSDAIASLRPDGTITTWNPGAERLFGYPASEAVGRPYSFVIPPGREGEERSMLARVAAGERVDGVETTRMRSDGSEIVVSVSLAPLLDGAGKVVGISRIARDLTAQRRAEETIRRTEEQLLQAQKMEAVGRLAGGIAHDFNNVLSIILSYEEILSGDLRQEDPRRADLAEIRKAAQRAASLTRQLLLFSRQQVTEPRVVDLGAVLASMHKMLDRLVGEDVRVALACDRSLWHVLVDPSNVEQVIMNLVVNARDAMPTGGSIEVEARNVELDEEDARAHMGSQPGPHVMLAVTDTGTGMDAATMARIFEPFYTTKEVGKGTGLGLSTVFGIAQRCGGSVRVGSEVGKGTRFEVYFPRVDAEVDAPRTSVHPATLEGHETVLLVEDEEQLRSVTRSILERAGYHVVVARTPNEALALCEVHPMALDMLLTDVVMPEMSGAELARRVMATRPGIRTLCMSGYTDETIIRHGILEKGIAFLQKPFTPDLLVRKVREVLDVVRETAATGGRLPPRR
ncbi:MAG TPA: PAS domain S-box protein [Polyangiaceae bacterium]